MLARMRLSVENYYMIKELISVYHKLLPIFQILL